MMCNCKPILNYNVYDKIEVVKNINNLYEIKNGEEQFTDEELINFLNTLFGSSSTDIPFMSSYLEQWIASKLMANNKLGSNVKPKFHTTSKLNIDNFVIAKSYNFLNTMKYLANTIKDKAQLILNQKAFSNVMLNVQQKTEEQQVDKVSTIVNHFSTTNPKSKLLEYVSERDNRVRPEHKKQDGTIRSNNDPYWNKAILLLTQWNCRCHIIESTADHMTVVKPIDLNEETQEQPSDIDFQKGKAIMFTQSLPVFQNIPDIVRKRFNKNGF